MISLRNRLRSQGYFKLANILQSIITSLLATPFTNHPKISGCVQYLSTYLSRSPDANAEKVFALLGTSLGYVTFNKDNFVKLVLKLNYAQTHYPVLLDKIESQL